MFGRGMSRSGMRRTRDGVGQSGYMLLLLMLAVAEAYFAVQRARGELAGAVDSERVALTRQFFNKTRANLDANPQAQVIVVDPGSGDQFALDLRYLHTESEGPVFDEVEANLAAVASQMGMSDVFRLRGVDIHRVLRCDPFGETSRCDDIRQAIQDGNAQLAQGEGLPGEQVFAHLRAKSRARRHVVP